VAGFTGKIDKHYTIFLASQGYRETLSLDTAHNSGNFTDLVKLLLKYYPVL
jgi:allantoicase